MLSFLRAHAAPACAVRPSASALGLLRLHSGAAARAAARPAAALGAPTLRHGSPPCVAAARAAASSLSSAAAAAPLPAPLRAPPAGGLFGAGFLRAPADFAAAASAAMRVSDALVAQLEAAAASPAPLSPALALASLQRLDAVSDTLCKVLDAAECVRSLAADGAWCAAAEGVFASLGAYMFALNAHAPLHTLLARITGDAALMRALTAEGRRVAVMLQREFEQDGVHLAAAPRARLVALKSATARLSEAFTAGAGAALAAAPAARLRRAAFPSLAAMPPHVRAGVLLEGGGAAATAAIPLHSAAAQHLLRHCPDEAVRRALLTAQLAAPAGNAPALHALRDAREEAACAFAGFDSYAHMVTFDRLAGRPEHAIAFLQTLAAAVLPRALEELAELAEEKARVARGADYDAGAGAPLPPAASGSSGGGGADIVRRVEDACVRLVRAGAAAGATVHAWDVAFLGERVLQRRSGGADSAAPPQQQQQQQLQLSVDLASALRGLQLVCRRVFGIELTLEALGVGEAWDGGAPYEVAAASAAATAPARMSLARLGSQLFGGPAAAAPPSDSSRIIKLRLQRPEEGELGTVYLDLFARPGKFPGAAHFVVRSGKQLHDADGMFEAAVGAAAPAPAALPGAAPAQQLPIVVLATNFMAASADGAVDGGSSSSGSGGSSGSARLPAHLAGAPLSASQLVTLWHEFGHALHSLLSRTAFQHVAGTRSAVDFVEVPSHTMEYWVRDFRVFREWAGAAAEGGGGGGGGGATPPPRFLRDFETAQSTNPRSAFAALDMQTNIAHALFDMALHGSPACLDRILSPLPAASLGGGAGAGAGAAGELTAAGGLLAGDYRATPRLCDVRSGIERAAAAWGEQERASPRAAAAGDERARVLALLRECGVHPEELCLVRRMPAAGDAVGTAALHRLLAVPLGDALPELLLEEGAAGDAPSSRSRSRAGGAAPPSSFRRAWHRDSSALLRAVEERHLLTPAVAGSAWQAGCTHLVTYGAGYYSYLLATAASAALWGELFAADPWARASGERLRGELLSRGGGDDPALMLGRLLGCGGRTLPLLPLLQSMRAL